MQAMGPIPAHIPPALAMPWPLSPLFPPEDPFETIIPCIHAGPEVFYGIDVIGPGMGSWVFRRDEDIRAIYLDTRHFTSAGRGTLSHMLGETWEVIPVDTDGADHAAYRALLNPLFTPARAARLDDNARALARELIAGFANQGQCEFIGSVCPPPALHHLPCHHGLCPGADA